MRRTQLDSKDRQALAAANALRHFSAHRHQAHWQILGIEPARPLFDKAEPEHSASHEAERYESKSCGSKPFDSKPYPSKSCHAQPGQAESLRQSIERIVLPAPSAVEDETGNINVIVWKDLQQRYRQALLSSKLLLVKGIMECKNEVIHVIAGELIDHSEVLNELTIKSRDFH